MPRDSAGVAHLHLPYYFSWPERKKEDMLVDLSLTRLPPRAVSWGLPDLGTSAYGRADGLEGLEKKLISKRLSVGMGRAAMLPA